MALLLLIHPIALDDPVIPLGPGDGRTEPDLLVRGLFVEDVGAYTRGDDVQYTGLQTEKAQYVSLISLFSAAFFFLFFLSFFLFWSGELEDVRYTPLRAPTPVLPASSPPPP